MTTNLEDLGSNKVRIEIKVPPERFEQALDEVFRKTRGNYIVPGFRKGKAPRPVIEQRFGAETFYSDALDILLQRTFPEALEQVDVEVVGQPEDVKVDEISREGGVTFSIISYVMPVPELGEWKGLHAKRVHYEATDEMVDAEVQSLAEENARWIPVDEPAQTDDDVIIDFYGAIDGEPMEDKGEDVRLILGSGMFVPGFENQLVGMKAGEERDITVRFPAKGYDKAVAGKDADFHVTMKEVRRMELPELDDEFVQDVSEYDTMDEFRDYLRSKIQDNLDQRTKAELDNDLVFQIVNETKLDIPDPMVKADVEDNVRAMRRNFAFQGLKLEDVLEQQDLTMDEFIRQQTIKAGIEIKMRLVIRALVEATGVEATDELREERMKELAEGQGITADAFREKMTPDQKEAIDYGIQVDMMLDKVIENAEIEDVDAKDLPARNEEAEAEEEPGIIV